MEINRLCEMVIGSAIAVHRALGPGLLESAYQKRLGIELESQRVFVEPMHKAQLLTYLRLPKLPVGLLLNFNNSTLKEGIVRMRL